MKSGCHPNGPIIHNSLFSIHVNDSREGDKKQDAREKGCGRDKFSQKSVPFLQTQCDKKIHNHDGDAEESGAGQIRRAADRRAAGLVYKMNDERLADFP